MLSGQISDFRFQQCLTFKFLIINNACKKTLIPHEVGLTSAFDLSWLWSQLLTITVISFLESLLENNLVSRIRKWDIFSIMKIDTKVICVHLLNFWAFSSTEALAISNQFGGYMWLIYLKYYFIFLKNDTNISSFFNLYRPHKVQSRSCFTKHFLNQILNFRSLCRMKKVKVRL